MRTVATVFGIAAVFLFAGAGLRWTGRWRPAIGQNWKTSFAGACFTLAWLIHEGAFR